MRTVFSSSNNNDVHSLESFLISAHMHVQTQYQEATMLSKAYEHFFYSLQVSCPAFEKKFSSIFIKIVSGKEFFLKNLNPLYQ